MPDLPERDATVELPGLLAGVLGVREIPVRAATPLAALRAAVAAHPALHVHLFDESGALREHVLCLHDGVNTRWAGALEAPLRGGDRIVVMQAVSGG